MELNYSELGFKCGLEIHQQLDSHKLFCQCESTLRQEQGSFEIKRKLHAIAGESGEIDKAAQYQANLNKEFIYQGYDSTCLVELDEEPPHNINQEALKIAIEIAILLNCKIIPITQIMRKTVIDGSNTSGFQRTVLIANNGFIETEFGKVGINAVILEEDACRIVEKDNKKVIYKLDRLGIPLVEVVTAPDIKTPKQAKQASLKIGEILRSCKVKRGIGTIRQDVSISIKGGQRIEMKGVQDPKIIIDTINNEIKRQEQLVKEKKSVSEVRKGNPDCSTDFLRPMPGSARMYPETDLEILRIPRDLINNIKKNLPKLKSELEHDFKKTGLSQEMIKLLFKQNQIEEFKLLLHSYNDPNLVAKVLLMFPKEIATKKNISIKKVEKLLDIDILIFILNALDKNKFPKSHIKTVMEKITDGNTKEESIIFEKQDNNIIEEKIRNIIKSKSGLNPNAYMGLVMKEFKGKVDGKFAMEIIKKFVK